MSKHLSEAIDFAVSNSLLKFNTRYELTHAPFSLTPCSVSPDLHQQISSLTPVFNAMWLKIANDTAFLKNALEKTARTDDFIRNLLGLLPKGLPATSLQMLLSRNDFLLEDAGTPSGQMKPKQVEFNTISNSFPSLSRQVTLLHHYLSHKGILQCSPVANDPLEEAVDSMAAVIKTYDYPDSCMLMVVQKPEQNIFDQRAVEYRLLEKHRILTIRMTLDEIAENGQLSDGHLLINGQKAALTYFRAGYAPADYPGTAAWKAREMIESSSSIKCPSVGMQLAGAKKIQQLLCKPDILRRFAEEDSFSQVQETFVGLYALDDTIEGVPAVEAACQSPGRFVLKPQREGGGNNLYGDEMKASLSTMPESEQHAYILMERIEAVVTPAELVVESVSEKLPSISEIGRYGICFAEGNRLIENRDAGYLVRTKSADMDEGGVCAGYACLNSLCLND